MNLLANTEQEKKGKKYMSVIMYLGFSELAGMRNGTETFEQREVLRTVTFS